MLPVRKSVKWLSLTARAGLCRSESALKLRDVVTSETDARIVVLDLYEVSAIGGFGFGVLVFLRRWAREHNIRRQWAWRLLQGQFLSLACIQDRFHAIRGKKRAFEYSSNLACLQS